MGCFYACQEETSLKARRESEPSTHQLHHVIELLVLMP